MTKIKDPDAREYYLRMTAEMGWSRNVLAHQIGTDAYGRQRKSAQQHNFQKTLAPALAEQADEAMKDVYALDFLGITKPVVERELERRNGQSHPQRFAGIRAGFFPLSAINTLSNSTMISITWTCFSITVSSRPWWPLN
jgi:predicted nuclease of restriction endonuclease-like (RecB) superfamily